MAEQSAELHILTHTLPDHGNDPDRRGLLVHHTDGHLIRDNACNRRRLRIPGHGNHIKPHGADTGHRFQFLKRQRPGLHRVDHPLILAHRDKCAGKSSHVGRCHHTALFYLIVEQREGRRRPRRSRPFQTDLTENIRHGVPDCRCRRKGQIHNAKGHLQSSGCLLCHKLSHSRHFEGCLLDRLTKHFKTFSPHFLQSRLHNARAADADIDNLIGLRYAMKSPGHKRIIVRCVAKYHQLRTAHGILFLCQFCGLSDDISHHAYRIHIDTGTGGTQIDAAAHPLRAGKRLGNGFHQQPVRFRHPFCHKSGVPADKIDSHLFCRPVKHLRYGNKILRRFAAGAAHQCDGSKGYPLIDNGNSKLF